MIKMSEKGEFSKIPILTPPPPQEKNKQNKKPLRKNFS